MDFIWAVIYGIEIMLGLGFVIFAHELGHFLMAKRNGVRVEAFSLGMGPILWKRVWRGTEYRLSVIPLGGYVKMSGENISDPRTGAPDELTSKSAWQRLQIFSAGVIMNFAIAFPLAILAFLLGQSRHVAEFATVAQPEAAAGIRPSDEAIEVNGVPISTMEEYRMIMVALPQDSMVPVKVRRDGNVLELHVKQAGSKRHVSIPPINKLGKVPEESLAYRAGLREGDVVRTIDGQPAILPDAFNELLRSKPGRPLSIVVERGEGTEKRAVALEVTLPAKAVYRCPPDFRLLEAVYQKQKDTPGHQPVDVLVNGQPFLVNGDRITRIGDRPIRSFQDLKEAIEPSGGVPIEIERERDGQRATATIVPMFGRTMKGIIGFPVPLTKRIADVPKDSFYAKQGFQSGDEILSMSTRSGEIAVVQLFDARPSKEPMQVTVLRNGQKKEITIEVPEQPVGDLEALGLPMDETKSVVLLAENTFVRKWGFGEAVRDGLKEPVNITVMTFNMVVKLFAGHESVRELAGPVGIIQGSFYQASARLGNLVWFMALISVSLGIFNILPIPVLDGGHVLLLAIEKVRRRPPSQRFVEYFQLAGLMFLLALILFVTFNDFTRLLA